MVDAYGRLYVVDAANTGDGFGKEMASSVARTAGKLAFCMLA